MPMGCRGCLGLLMAEVSLAEFFFSVSACACDYSFDGPKLIPKQNKTKHPSLMLVLLQFGPESQIIPASMTNLAKLVCQYKHEPALSYQGQLVQQPIFLSPNHSPFSIRLKWTLQLCLYINLTTLVVD